MEDLLAFVRDQPVTAAVLALCAYLLFRSRGRSRRQSGAVVGAFRAAGRVGFSRDIRAYVWYRDQKTCYLCKQPIRFLRDVHLDHIVPIARGGTNDEGNLRATHVKCNLRKGVRSVAELD